MAHDINCAYLNILIDTSFGPIDPLAPASTSKPRVVAAAIHSAEANQITLNLRRHAVWATILKSPDKDFGHARLAILKMVHEFEWLRWLVPLLNASGEREEGGRGESA